jgi:septum formation protein
MIFDMLGIAYCCRSPKFQEEFTKAAMEKPITRIPEFFAVHKALSISTVSRNDLVISYDTAVFYKGRMLGKPADGNHAFEMLKILNGRTHQVITGVALARNNKIISSGKELTEVTFSRTQDKLLKQYAFSQESEDKAGSYAIQGRGALLVKKIDGCYYNVVGVPIQLTLKMLKPYFNENT